MNISEELKKRLEERRNNNNRKSDTTTSKNSNSSTSDILKTRLGQRKAISDFGLDTLQTDLTTLSKTISSVYSGWQTQETMRNTLSSVQSMHERLGKYQEYQQKYGGTDLSELQSAYKSVLDGWDGLSTEYAKYKNADAFNASKKIALMDKDYSGLTYDEVQSKKKEYDENSFEYKYFDNYTKYKDLNEFDKAIEARKSNKSKPKTTLGSEAKTFNPDDFKLYETNKDKPTSLLDAVNTPKTEELFKPHEFTPESKEEYYQGLALKSRDLEAERNKWSLDHQFDLHKDVMQNEDFAENSKYISTESEHDSFWDKIIGGKYGMGYGDLEYEYINNNIEGIRDEIRNRGTVYSRDTQNLGSLITEHIWEKGYEKLNPDEVAVYNYWHNYDKANGTNKAQEFLADMEINLNKRTYDEQTKRWETANENPILATLNSIASVPASVFGAIPTAVDAGLDAIQGKAYNPYSKAKTFTNFAQDTREYVGDNIAEATKGAEFLGQNIPSFLYQTGMSLADNLMGASTLKNAYLPMMSTNAFHQKAKEMTEAGEDKATIYTTALASAAAEMVFEKISLDRFLKIKGVDSKISIITNTLKQAGVEASEEFFTEIANLISDDVIRGDDSELKKKYQDLLASGYSESEANTEIAKQIGSQIGWAAVGGGLSGGAMGYVGALGNYTENSSKGSEIKSNERISDMLDIASNPEIGEAYEAYTKYANKGITADNISNAQLGNLYTSAKSGAVEAWESKKASAEQKRTASDTLDRLSVVDTENTVAKRAKELNVGEETKVTESGENAKIEGIKVTKDGTSVVTNNGEVALDDMTLSQNDSELVAYAEQITKEQGEDVGNLFISQYDGEMDMSEYGHSFDKVSLLSKYDSVTLDDIIEVKGELSATQATKIYNGVRAAFEKANKESTEKALEKMRNGMHKKGFVDDTIFDYDNASTVDSGRINWNDLNERQRASITFTKGLFSALGNRVVYVGKNKKFNGMYHIDGDTIFIDAYAGMDVVKGLGRDSIIPTASHELTHQMKMYSRETYNEVKEIVLDALTKVAQVTDKSITRGDIIRAELDRLNEKHSDKEHSEEEAIDELIAKACEDMLSVSKEGVKLFNSLSESEQKKLTERIKDILAKLKNWINDLLKSYKSNSAEAQALRSMQDAFDEVSKRWDKMLVDIAEQNKSRNESVSAESTETIDVNEVVSIGSRDLGEFSEALDTDGNQLFQYRAMEEDKETYRATLLKHKKVIGISAIQIEELFDTIDSAIDIISENLEALDYAWEADIDDRAFSPIKPNSDSLYKVSLDFSTLCRKRLLQQTIQATLQETLNKQLSKEEAIAIRDELMKVQEEGKQIEVACALCYVESARMKSPKQINKFLDNREAIIKEFFANRSGGSIKEKIKNAEMKARETLKKSYPDGIPGKNDATLDVLTAPLSKMLKADAEFVRGKKKEAKASYKLTAHEQAELESAKNMNVADFTSAKGLENLAKNHPDLFDAYTSFVRNATHSKGIENDVWWRAGDSDAIGDNLIAQMNAENGLRSQSWSDFQVIHLLDYIAATIELSTKGAKRQSYTKVPDYVRLLGNTGDMINMSVIPERAFSGKLGYDDVEGMAYKIAVELRQRYHNTAGIICIGMNDKQIRLLLADDTIDMVIPYHSSSMSKDTRKLMHIPAWKDYQAYQNEKKLSEEEAEARAKEYGVKLIKDDNYQKAPKFSEWFDLEEARQIAKMENANPSDKVAQKKYGVMYGGYKAMQNAADKYLKLCAERGIAPKFSHENADYTHEANYWKLLIDRKMVDNVTGEIIEQKAIKPIFDKNDVLGILDDELERYPQVKADQEYASRKVVQKFLSGDMKMDESTRKAIQTPIDNITEVNILESAERIADEGKMMHSDRVISVNMSEDERYEILKDKRISLVQNTTDNAYDIDFDFLENNIKSVIEKPLRNKLRNLGYLKNYKTEAIDIEFEFTGKGLGKSLHSQTSDYGGNFADFTKVILNLQELLDSSMLIEMHTDKAKGTDKEKRGLEKVYVLFGALIDQGKIIPVQFEVEQYLSEENRLYLSVALTKIEIGVMGNTASDEQKATSLLPISDISIADIFAKINPFDKKFLKYVPNQFLNDEQIKAKEQALEEERKKYFGDVRYSDREEISVYDLMGEADRLSKENENLRADIERLNERLKIEKKVTHGNYFNENQLGAVAGHLRNISKSNMDKVELMKSLKDVYSFIAHSENLTWEDVLSKCYVIADKMIAESKPETVVDDYSKHILDDIRSKRISLSEAQKNEAQYIFGKNWNRNFFGRVTITDSGISLKDQWREWADIYPSIFDANITDTDMPGALYDILGSLKEASEVVVEYDLAEKTRWLATEIYNQYWNVSPIRTTADKYDKQIKRLNFEHRNAMKELRDSYDTRLKEQQLADDIHYAGKLGKQEAKYEAELAERKARIEKQKELYKNLRDRKDAQIAEAKQKGRERLDKYKENAERKTIIQSTMATVMSLKKKLTTNSKDVHIPEPLKPVVVNLINAIDFSSKQLLGMSGTKKDARGLPTKSDIATETTLSKVHSMESGKDAVALRTAIEGALKLFENAEKMLNSASDGTVDSSVVALDVDMIDSINEMINDINFLVDKGETTFVLNKMSTKHLKTLNGMVKSINHWAIVADKALANKHKKRISDLGIKTIEDLDKLGPRQEYIEAVEDIKDFFNWNNLLPINAFKRMGDAPMEFFDGLRDSQDTATFNRQEIMDFTGELLDKYKDFKPKNWRTEVKTFEVKLPGEKETTTISMPISYIMTLYCVSKQEDAQRHLYGEDALGNKLTYEDGKGNIRDGGGMIIKGFKDKKLTLKVNKSLDNKIVNETIVKQITSVLTKEQKEVADALQWYMNTKGSEWGDAISMALYGIKKFSVKDYFPIIVNPHELSADKIRDEKASMFAIINYGFTKERNPGAKQSIEIGDIFEIFANHMNMVAIYNAYALSVFDIARWYNFKGTTEKGKKISVTSSIETAFGKGALLYVDNLIKDLNGQHESSRLGFVSKMFKNAKSAMVGFSPSVTFLQPTAYFKAMTKISPKYLLKSALYVKDFGAHKGVKKAKKYCGIALLKSQGYFETGVSANTTTKLLHDESFKEKAINISLKVAEYFDETTWGILWNACEFEVRATRKDLEVGSKEFYNFVGEKLRDVIYETQVVDSPLTKSNLMRSPDTGAKMVTMFASEMTVAYNLVAESLYEISLDVKRNGKEGSLKRNGKRILTALTAYSLTSVANAIVTTALQEFLNGGGDDDDEEAFEKFLSNFIADWLFVGKIPYVKEILSYLQGYSASRPDLAAIESAIKAYRYWEKIVSGKAKDDTLEKAINKTLESYSYFVGVGYHNIEKNLVAILKKLGILDD